MPPYHYGLATPQETAPLSGKELLQAIIDGKLPQAPISQTMAFWIVEVGDGFAAFEGEPGPQLLNPMGTVHGGWALTLIDSVAGCAGRIPRAPDHLRGSQGGGGRRTSDVARHVHASGTASEPRLTESHQTSKYLPRASNKASHCAGVPMLMRRYCSMRGWRKCRTSTP